MQLKDVNLTAEQVKDLCTNFRRRRCHAIKGCKSYSGTG